VTSVTAVVLTAVEVGPVVTGTGVVAVMVCVTAALVPVVFVAFSDTVYGPGFVNVWLGF